MELAVPTPSLSEQRYIVQGLKSVQNAKEARKREVALERECKAALMEQLFTYGTHGEKTKQTEIGEIPESWQVVKVGDVVRITSGGTPSRKRSDYWHGGIPWVKTGEINYNLITTTSETISKEGLENSAARIIPKGTLLMAMYGQGVTRGRTAILGIDAAINQACAALFPVENVLVKFLFYFFTYNYNIIRNMGHGANQRNLNSEIIKLIKIPLPSVGEQSKIVDVLNVCDSKIAALQKERTLLEELFRTMLEELMTGRSSTIPLIKAEVSK